MPCVTKLLEAKADVRAVCEAKDRYRGHIGGEGGAEREAAEGAPPIAGATPLFVACASPGDCAHAVHLLLKARANMDAQVGIAPSVGGAHPSYHPLASHPSYHPLASHPSYHPL